MINGQDSVAVPLSLFGGVNTELAPSDLPEGVSPAASDCAFLPGSVFTRPALQRVFAAPLSNSTTLYQKTFARNSGLPANLYLDSNGSLWKQEVFQTPAAATLIAGVQPASYSKSVTAFNREFFPFCNGVNGSDVPRQLGPQGWFDRVTQDGPGAPPTSAADYSSGASIVSIGVNSSTIASGGIVCVTDPSGTFAQVTITTTAAHGLTVGSVVQIVGAGQPYINGQQTVLTVPSTTTFTIQVVFVAGIITGIGRVSNVAEVDSLTAHNLIVGDTVSVMNVADTTFNEATATVTSVPSAFQWEYSNSGSNTSPSPGSSATFIALTLATAGGGLVVSSATVTLSAPLANANIGDPLQITGSENSDTSTFPYDSNVGGNPVTWPILSISGSTITFGLTGIQGLTASNEATTGGNASVGGAISTGAHQVVQIFVTRFGAYTAPSPPLQWTSNGKAKVEITGLAIGPPNVVARLLAFTGSGGDNFFAIPNALTFPNPTGSPIVVSPTLIPDNTTTSVILDFSDNALFGAVGIDIPGNNLFGQIKLALCSGFFEYASRLFAFGEDNVITNLLNMGFDGGYIAENVPTGWTVPGSGGALATGAADFGFAWQITGAGAGIAGQVTQPACTDQNGIQILQPLTQYTFKAWLKASAVGLAGSIVCDIYSPGSSTVLASATIAASAVTMAGGFIAANFGAAMPATIPADAILRVYADDLTNAATVSIDEIEIVYANQPYMLGARASYINNEEAFCTSTGYLAPSSDPNITAALFKVRETLYFGTLNGGTYSTVTGNGEPSTWTIAAVTGSVGPCSFRACDAGRYGSGDAGEEWGLIATQAGLYIFNGGEIGKISQEIQTLWNSINPEAFSTVWVKNDSQQRRIYVGAPLGSATSPNVVLALDYRELETAYAIQQNSPIHISFTGKMIASDLTRKWCEWSTSAPCGEIMAQSNGSWAMQFGSGNGEAPGDAPGFGNAYTLNLALYADDDYGVIPSYYATYFFVNHEAEQALRTPDGQAVGSGRKLFDLLRAYITGIGTVQMTPLIDSLTNAGPAPIAYPLRSSLNFDYEWGLNAGGNRCAIKVVPSPLAGQTDCNFNLNKLILNMKANQVSPVRGSIW